MRRIYLSNKKLISRIYETNNRGLANIRFQPGISYWPDWWFFIGHTCWLIFIDSDGCESMMRESTSSSDFMQFLDWLIFYSITYQIFYNNLY